MSKVYLAVDRSGEELLSSCRLERNLVFYEWVPASTPGKYVFVPPGTIEKLIGRKLTWQDEPVLWEGE